ncbi:MAG TPA: hypothetical protein DGG94_06230 [Micromonosporaceae bacterium]|nr:hypothetical protein [Micromonosporaceae bacterium]HCU49390.1 hypothetical protein [Micromonosporaceae bacterium]
MARYFPTRAHIETRGDFVGEILILGPIETIHDGASLVLSRRQQRVILGILALDAGRLVTIDRLVELLWGDNPPAQSRAVVHSRVSNLRTSLADLVGPEGDIALHSQGTGYVLDVVPEKVDAHRFLHMARNWKQNRSADESRHQLRTALGLWRGAAFGGEADGEVAAVLCEPLEAMRLTTYEDLFGLELAAGGAEDIADQAAEMALLNPLRERLGGQAMVALYQSGRGAEALHLYGRLRAWLRDELGTDPGNQLQLIHRAVMRDDEQSLAEAGFHPATPPVVVDAVDTSAADDELVGVAETPHTLPPPPGDFAGRDDEVARLVEALTNSAQEIVAITGPAGVGKTALSLHIAYKLAGEFPHGQLFADMRGFDGDAPVTVETVIARFLRALGAEPVAASETFEELLDRYRTTLANRRVLVVLDNVASDEQIQPLIAGGGTCRIIINGRTRLGATIGAHRIDLDVMTRAQSLRLLSQLIGVPRVSAESQAAEDLAQQCGHLPLALRIAGAKLAAKPYWTIARLVGTLRDERVRLDNLAHGQLDVRVSIELTYAYLSEPAQRLLRAIGDVDLASVSVWLAAALLDTDARTAESVLEQLFDARLIDIAGYDPSGHPRFMLHDLIRLFASERADLDESAKTLAAARRRVYGAYLAIVERAYQSIYGGDFQNIRAGATRWAPSGHPIDPLGDEPLRWFDNEYQAILKVLRRAAEDGAAEAAWEIACTASPMFQMRRLFDEWHTALSVALGASRATGNRRGEAAIRYRLGWVAIDRTKYDEARAEFDDAIGIFNELGDAHGAATVRVYLGNLERHTGAYDRALACYRDAEEVLRAHGDHGGVAYVLRATGQVHIARNEFPEAKRLLDRALDIYWANGARQGAAQALFWSGMLALHESRLGDAKPLFAEALEIAQRIGDLPGVAQCIRGLGLANRAEGDFTSAATNFAEALRLVRQSKPTQLEEQIAGSLSDLPSTDDA